MTNTTNRIDLIALDLLLGDGGIDDHEDMTRDDFRRLLADMPYILDDYELLFEDLDRIADAMVRISPTL